MSEDEYLSYEQIEQLLRGINPRRVSTDARGKSHVEAYDVRAHLIRIFGFARWSSEVISQELVFETQHPMDHKNEKARGKWDVCYRSIVRLTISATTWRDLCVYTEGACGDCQNYPSRADAHDMALKTSESQALKRCAMNLGDQFGLSLYNKGQTAPLVGRTMVGMRPAGETASEQEAASGEIDGHITALAPEDATPTNVERETSSPPPQATRSADAAPAESPAPPPLTEAEQAVIDAVAEKVAAGEIPTEEKAIEAIVEAFPDAEVSEPLAWAAEKIKEASGLPPKDALVMLNEVLTVAVRQQLRQKRLPGSTETVGAAITRLMGLAAAHAGRDAG